LDFSSRLISSVMVFSSIRNKVSGLGKSACLASAKP
jgi:hypothetical protein